MNKYISFTLQYLGIVKEVPFCQHVVKYERYIVKYEKYVEYYRSIGMVFNSTDMAYMNKLFQERFI